MRITAFKSPFFNWYAFWERVFLSTSAHGCESSPSDSRWFASAGVCCRHPAPQQKRPVAPPSARPQCRGLFQGTRDRNRLRSLNSSSQSKKLSITVMSSEFQGHPRDQLIAIKKRPAAFSNNEPLLGRLAERPHANSSFVHERRMNKQLLCRRETTRKNQESGMDRKAASAVI